MSLSSKSTENLVGEWEGTDNGEVFSLIFDNEGFVYLKQNNKIQGGKQFSIDDKTGSLTYVFDKTTQPYQLDMIFTDHDLAESKTGLGIINFIDENTVEVELGDENVRPSDFTQFSTVVLHRIK